LIYHGVTLVFLRIFLRLSPSLIKHSVISDDIQCAHKLKRHKWRHKSLFSLSNVKGTMRNNSCSSLLAIALFMAVVLACANSPRTSTQRKVLTFDEHKAIYDALRTKHYSSPSNLEINDSGWLVATYELQSIPTGGFEAFATNALVTIREAMLPFKTVEMYRVTLNGPSPGTGLIRRYGSARFIEGGRVEWESGVH
jgi:hypothetical protein